MSDARVKPESKPARARNHKARVREESIERILDAAEQLFAEFGYHGVTLKDVAKRVGVSSTLIHYHFSGKESIAIDLRPSPGEMGFPLSRGRADLNKSSQAGLWFDRWRTWSRVLLRHESEQHRDRRSADGSSAPHPRCR